MVSSSTIPTYQIVKEYLEIILNWPFLGAVLVFYFVFYYKNEIRKILSSARLNKIGNAEFVQAEKEKTELEISTTQSADEDQNWELKYYGKTVASNTMRSLAWLHNTGSSTKANFFHNMVCPPDYSDIPAEKEAQFSIMLNYKFIELKGESYTVTPKGEELLEYYKFI